MEKYQAIAHATNIAIFWLCAKLFFEKPASWFRLSLLFYSLVFFLGYSFVILMEAAFGYKMPLYDLDIVYRDSLIGITLLSSAHWVSKRLLSFIKKSTASPPPSLTQSEQLGLLTLGLLSLASLLLFVAFNGIGLGSGDYEHRYDSSRGWGIVLLFFPAFLPLCYHRLRKAQSLASFLAYCAAFILWGALTYAALSGYRQILIGVMIVIFISGVQRGYFKLWHMLPGSLALLASVVFLSFVRYSGDSGPEFDSPLIAAAYYLQGDLFPIDAALKIFISYDLHQDYRYLDVISSHFAKVVPRSLWPDKPDIVLDAAGYYTQVIVGYARGVTLSPTLLGEGYMAGGSFGVYALLAGSGALLALFDTISERSGRAFQVFSCAYLYSTFFFVREGLAELLLRWLFLGIFYAVFILISHALPTRKRRPLSHDRLHSSPP